MDLVTWDQMNYIFSRYPTLMTIWEDYGTSELWLNYGSLMDKVKPINLFSCVMNRLLPLSIKNFSLKKTVIGRFYIRLDKAFQVIRFDYKPYNIDRYYTNRKKIIQLLIRKFAFHKNNLFVGYITIVIEGQEDGHANTLLINTANRTIERFEPHVGYKGILYTEPLDIYLAEFVRELRYIYLPPLSVCPISIQGWQTLESQVPKAKGEIGYCLMWSIFYAYLRLVYPEIESSEIIDDFSEIDPKLLRTIIRIMTSLIIDLCT